MLLSQFVRQKLWCAKSVITIYLFLTLKLALSVFKFLFFDFRLARWIELNMFCLSWLSLSLFSGFLISLNLILDSIVHHSDTIPYTTGLTWDYLIRFSVWCCRSLAGIFSNICCCYTWIVCWRERASTCFSARGRRGFSYACQFSWIPARWSCSCIIPLFLRAERDDIRELWCSFYHWGVLTLAVFEVWLKLDLTSVLGSLETCIDGLVGHLFPNLLLYFFVYFCAPFWFEVWT